MRENKYFITLYKWVDFEGEGEKLKEIEVESPEVYETLKEKYEEAVIAQRNWFRRMKPLINTCWKTSMKKSWSGIIVAIMI